MKVLVLKDEQLGYREITNELEDLQKIVGGYIEIPFLSKVFNANVIDVIINEEGKFIEGLRPEIAVVDGGTGVLLDVIYGNCVFASHDDEGNTTELNEEQTRIIEQELCLTAKIKLKDNKVFNVRVLVI